MPTLEKRTNVTANYLRQIKNKNIIQNGKPKGIGDKIASKLEKGMNKPKGWLDQDHSDYDVNAKAHCVKKSFSYPLISAVQAGAFTSTYDLQDSEGYEMLDSETATKGESFFLRISGRSMETKFSEGDLVLIDTGRVPQPGNYVAAVNGSGEATFKMYKQLGELSESGNPHFELVPLNSVFPTLSSLKQDIRIIGVAVEHRSYL
ncbi:S24 family peptidase [Phocoenobacter skyensis]